MYQVENVNDFRLGFWFAIQVARSLDYKSPPDTLIKQLTSVKEGDLTLMPSPEDALSEFATHRGRPLSDAEIQAVRSQTPNRTQEDARNRALASLILQQFGR